MSTFLDNWLLRRAMSAPRGGGGKYIQFADPAVEAVCVQNFSSDGIGLTMQDAAAVTSLGNVFQGNTSIVSFDELQYFTGVTMLGIAEFKGCTALVSIDLRNITRIRIQAFYDCSALSIDINMPQLLGSYYSKLEYETFRRAGIRRVLNLGGIEGISGYSNFAQCNSLTEAWLPATVNEIGPYAFDSCPNLVSLVCLATIPPSGANGLVWGNTSVKIYVPYSSDHSILDAYKAASGWSTYATQIFELNPDGTIPS